MNLKIVEFYQRLEYAEYLKHIPSLAVFRLFVWSETSFLGELSCCILHLNGYDRKVFTIQNSSSKLDFSDSKIAEQLIAKEMIFSG